MKPSFLPSNVFFFSTIKLQSGSNKKQQSNKLHRERSFIYFVFLHPLFFFGVIAHSFLDKQSTKKLLHPDVFTFCCVSYTNTCRRQNLFQSNKNKQAARTLSGGVIINRDIRNTNGAFQ